MKLDKFTSAYIQTLFWSSANEEGDNFDSFSKFDLSDDALQKIVAECEKFQSENHDLIFDAIQTNQVVCGPDFDELERAGHDFCLTRNHHGAGFWDGDWPEPYAQKLTDAAHAFGAMNIYFGDDGKIYTV